MKRALVRAATSPWVAPLFSPLVRDSGTVFMLHRFADRERGNDGHDPAMLRSQLAWLRRSGREIVTAEEIVRRAREDDFRGTSPIAFTVDDGYADFATVASPIFAEFECPVTVFLVSGVLDGEGWYWWDRISAAFEQTLGREITLTIGDRSLRVDWATIDERRRAEAEVMEALKPVRDDERLQLLDALPSVLGVMLPPRPPGKYAPMTWDQVRQCGTRGATFGAHTVSHPILSRVGSPEAQWEIETSWRRLREESVATTNVFCYPNGGPSDFGERETALLSDIGFGSAVTTVPGHVTSTAYHATPDAPFRVPRFSYPENSEDFVQITSGLEHAKGRLRRLMQ